AMDRARDELFAGAAIARDQHAALRRRHLFDVRVELLHRGALADHLVAPLDVGAQARHFALELVGLERVLDAHEDAIAIERFLEEGSSSSDRSARRARGAPRPDAPRRRARAP